MAFPRRELVLDCWVKMGVRFTSCREADGPLNAGQRADASRAINCAIAPDRPPLRASVQDVVRSACFPA